MDDSRVFCRWEDLGFSLDEDEYGKLDKAKEEAPGVFFLRTESSGGRMGREYYVVTPKATPDIISPEVVSHGTADSGVWVFEYRDATDLYNLVKYEIMRYRVKLGLSLRSGRGPSTVRLSTTPNTFLGILVEPFRPEIPPLA